MQSGVVLAGRYRLDRLLGRGGMGEVWAGHDLLLGRAVAVKVLLATDPDEDEVKRFAREATVAAGLQHPGITVVFDAGAHEGQLFIVTELLSGQDLGKVLAAHPGGLPMDRVLDYGIQLADALAVAHGQGIVHRDLKPGNLFVLADERLAGGRLKVCDFGLARDLKSSTRLTRAGDVFGTPAYMAPEQWQTSGAAPAADLYAVGCILYELLTGRLPFDGPSLPTLMVQHLTQPPVPPRDLKPGIPAALNDLVLSLLAKEPASRPASAAEVLTVLTRLRDAPQQAVMHPKTLTHVRDVGRQAVMSAKTPETRVPSRLIRALTGHTNQVFGVAFSPDSTVLATGSADGTARLWDVATGQAIRAPADLADAVPLNDSVFAVAFSPDGTLLAVGSYARKAQLWDIATGRAIRTLVGHTKAVFGVAFSPDGSLLATGSADGTAWVWDIATGQAIRTLAGHAGNVYAVAFSPDGSLLAVGSTDGTRLWDIATGRAVRALSGDGGGVSAVAFSPDGSLLATGRAIGSGDGVRLWDVATGRAVRALVGRGGTVSAVAFSPDGSLLAAGGGDMTVQLWDIATGQAVRALVGHAGAVSALAFSPDGSLLATGSDDRTARLWGLEQTLADGVCGRSQLPLPSERVPALPPGAPCPRCLGPRDRRLSLTSRSRGSPSLSAPSCCPRSPLITARGAERSRAALAAG